MAAERSESTLPFPFLLLLTAMSLRKHRPSLLLLVTATSLVLADGPPSSRCVPLYTTDELRTVTPNGHRLPATRKHPW